MQLCPSQELYDHAGRRTKLGAINEAVNEMRLIAMMEILKKEPVDYVNPNIGAIGQLLAATSPVVALPHGMAQSAPITTLGLIYRYIEDKISGLRREPAVFMAA